MRVSILSDTHWEAKVEHATRTLSLDNFFAERDYGPNLTSLVVVLMCRDPELKFKRRVRLNRKTHTLYSDIMLDLPEMRSLGHAGRRSIIAQRLVAEIPPTIAKYRLRDFDLPRFIHDFQDIIEEQLLGAESSRYDHLCLA
jgi:hypothetical protein